MASKLIVIEGLDGGGKTTQLELLKKTYTDFRYITFPNYDSPSGKIVSNYLSGVYSEKDKFVSAYTASSFYAIDRYTSFKTDWEKDFQEGKTIISARYVSSNAIYQMTKLPEGNWNEYMEWLFDMEYNKFKIPRPTATIFLDMPPEISRKLLLKRYNGDPSRLDAHESDLEFMAACRRAALYVAKLEGWHIIDCSENNEPKSIDTIHNMIKNTMDELLK